MATSEQGDSEVHLLIVNVPEVVASHPEEEFLSVMPSSEYMTQVSPAVSSSQSSDYHASNSGGSTRLRPQRPCKYICPYCNKGCAKPSVLEKHVRAHTGERPFPCQTCDIAFKTKSNLYKHQKSRLHYLTLEKGGRAGSFGSSGKSESSCQESTIDQEGSLETLHVGICDCSYCQAPPSKEEPVLYLRNLNNGALVLCRSPVDNNVPAIVSMSESQTSQMPQNRSTQQLEKFSYPESPMINVKKPPISLKLPSVSSPSGILNTNSAQDVFVAHESSMAKNLSGALISRDSTKEIFARTKGKEIVKQASSLSSAGPLSPQEIQQRINELIDANQQIINTPMAEGPRPRRFSKQQSETLPSTKAPTTPVTKAGSLDTRINGERKGEHTVAWVGDRSQDMSAVVIELVDPLQPQRRGRPKGSKNLGDKSGSSEEESTALLASFKSMGSDPVVLPVTEGTFCQSPAVSGVVVKKVSHNDVKAKLLQKLHTKKSEESNSEVAHKRPCLQRQNNVYDSSDETIIPKITASPSVSSAPANLMPFGFPKSSPKSTLVNMSPAFAVPVSLSGISSLNTTVVSSKVESEEQTTRDHEVKQLSSNVFLPTSGTLIFSNEAVVQIQVPSTEKVLLTSANSPDSVILSSSPSYSSAGVNPKLQSVQQYIASTNETTAAGTSRKSDSSTPLILGRKTPAAQPSTPSVCSASVFCNKETQNERPVQKSDFGKSTADLDVMWHSVPTTESSLSISEDTDNPVEKCLDTQKLTQKKGNLGMCYGFKSEDVYEYVRGKGRGKYVCSRCGVRCKKPSSLRKHIRSHTNIRPYRCIRCKLAFKTKGNLTKHFGSKTHKSKEGNFSEDKIETDAADLDYDALMKQENIGILDAADTVDEANEKEVDYLLSNEMDDSNISNVIVLADNGTSSAPNISIKNICNDDLGNPSLNVTIDTLATPTCSQVSNVAEVASPVLSLQTLIATPGLPQEVTVLHCEPYKHTAAAATEPSHKRRLVRQATHITTCDECNLSFGSQDQLDRHCQTEAHQKVVHSRNTSVAPIQQSDPRPFKCDDCSISFRMNGHLSKHLRSKAHIMKQESMGKLPPGWFNSLENEKGIFSEMLCAENSFNILQLLQPQQIQVGGQNISKSNQIMLPINTGITIQDVKPPVLCIWCNSEFTDNESLKKHLATHIERRSNICSVCDAGFTTDEALQGHLKTHISCKAKDD